MLYCGFGFQLLVTMKFTIIYFNYGTMGDRNMSKKKSNKTNRNVTAPIANSFVFPTLTIQYVCLCTACYTELSNSDGTPCINPLKTELNPICQ